MTKLRSLFVLLALAMVIATAGARPAPAQTGTTPTELEALVSTIEDPAAREKLVGQLKAMIAAQKAQAVTVEQPTLSEGVIGGLSERLAGISRSIVATADVLRDAPKIRRWLNQQVSDPVAVERWQQVGIHLVAALAAGWIAEWLSRMLLQRPRRRLAPDGSEGVALRLLMITLGFLVDLLPLALFGAGAYGTLTLFGAEAEARVVALTIANTYLVSRAVLTLAEWLLIPPMPVSTRRRMAEETAHYLFIWVRRFVILIAAGYFTAEALLTLGLPRAGYTVLLKALGLIVWAMIVVLIL